MKSGLLFLLLLLSSQLMQAQMYEHTGDQGNGRYANPIVPADFSDLDAIRVGKDYYAISSTMQFSPGMVVLHSVDLVNWEIIGHVVEDLTKISPELNWNRMNRYGRGIWAGSIRYYNNKFWVYFGTPEEGFFMSSASNPAGPWEPLHQLWRVSGWDDCCSFQDDDGKLYFIATNFAKDSANNKEYNIHLFQLSSDGKSLLRETDSIIYQAKGSEANKLYKMNGFYYHFFSQVNELGQRYVMMGRAKHIYGPYEHRQLNKVDKVKDREPNQGALLDVGKNWFFLTHHGRGAWEGRPMSLLPVTWINEWPILGSPNKDTIGEMVWEYAKPIETKEKKFIQTSDGFQSSKLGVQWEWNYQPRKEKWSLKERPGYLRLHAFVPQGVDSGSDVLLRAGNTITQRSMRKQENRATVKIDIQHMQQGMVAGLTHFSTDGSSAIGIRVKAGQRFLVFRNMGKESLGPKIKGTVIWLRSNWNQDGVNVYSYSLDGKRFVSFGEATQLRWGSYRGDRIGLFAFNEEGEKGFVDVDWFENIDQETRMRGSEDERR